MIADGTFKSIDPILRFTDSEMRVDIEGIRFFIMLDRNFISKNHVLSTLLHKHGSIELFFVRNGQGRMRIGNKIYELSKNRIYIVNKGSFHNQSKDNTIEGYSFQIRYEITKNMEHTPHYNQHNLFIEKLSQLKDCVLEDRYDCCDIIEKIHQEMRDTQFGYYYKIQTYFAQIIINLMRMYNPDNEVSMELGKKSIDQSRTEIIDNFFYDTFDKMCSIEDLASLLGVSGRQLNRILKEEYGVSFKQKILEMRMEVAKDYLLHTDASISDISCIVGYSEPSNFCVLFKKNTGISPGVYRNLYKKISI